jgi:hypothetical protein
VLFFSAPLGAAKAAERGDTFLDQACVCRKDHVGQAGLRVYQAHLGMRGDSLVETLPLLLRQSNRRRVEISLHPGVDDVLHVEELRSAHQKNGAG